jgi:nitrite reductase (cytochrome c-552)
MCVPILEDSVDLAGQCRIECVRILAKHGVAEPVTYPDISTKEKAQAVIQQFIDGNPPKLL